MAVNFRRSPRKFCFFSGNFRHRDALFLEVIFSSIRGLQQGRISGPFKYL